MERLARKLANKMARALRYDEEKEQVIAYGMIAIIQTAITVLVVLLLGFAVGAPLEAMILCLSVSLLRRYTGGAHADSIELCTAISVIYCTAVSYVSRFVIGPVVNETLLITISAGIYLAAFLIVYRRAPVDSPNKPIRTEKKKKKMRRGAYRTLAVYFAASALLLLFGQKSSILYSLQVSLLFGIAWQMLTLIKAGKKLLGIINCGYHNVMKRKEV